MGEIVVSSAVGWMMTSTSGLVDNLVRGGSTMSFQHEPEAVKSATYHAYGRRV